jgi:stage V sporulation protein G
VEITEVRIKLIGDSDDRLQAFCSITFDDCFVVRDLKIIEGSSGPFVAMPSRKLTAHCPQCGCKNHLRSGYCNHCGMRLKDDLAIKSQEGRAKLYADIAHPINSTCRDMIQKRVIAEFKTEVKRSEEPGYVTRYDEDFVGEADLDSSTHFDPKQAGPRAPHQHPQRPASSDTSEEDEDDFGAGIF